MENQTWRIDANGSDPLIPRLMGTGHYGSARLRDFRFVPEENGSRTRLIKLDTAAPQIVIETLDKGVKQRFTYEEKEIITAYVDKLEIWEPNHGWRPFDFDERMHILQTKYLPVKPKEGLIPSRR